MWYNISNLLSYLRILLAIPTGYALWYDYNYTALMIGFVAGWTDFFDGYLARRLNQVSDIGKVVDPVADKLFAGMVVAILYLKGLMPIWFMAAVLGRDILIMLGGLLIFGKRKVVVMSNMLGKVTFSIILLALIMYILRLEEAAYWVSLATCVFLVLSFASYLKRALHPGDNNSSKEINK